MGPIYFLFIRKFFFHRFQITIQWTSFPLINEILQKYKYEKEKSKIKYFGRIMYRTSKMCCTLHKKRYNNGPSEAFHCCIRRSWIFFSNEIYACEVFYRAYLLDFLRDPSDEMILYIHELRCETWLQKCSFFACALSWENAGS